MLWAGPLSGCRPTPAATSTASASGEAPAVDGPASDKASSETPAAEGAPCLSAEGCASGVCEGQGCDDATPGVCAASDRMCTRDARQYCGCQGETFVGSGSCPGQRYAAPGPCEGDPGLGGAAPDPG